MCYIHVKILKKILLFVRIVANINFLFYINRLMNLLKRTGRSIGIVKKYKDSSDDKSR
jgi:hypothetical protein